MLNLSVILDIGIGLLFMYISLSLVASEIQELISTYLQFRSKHLKTSIKYLLIGSDVDSVNEIKQTKQLIDELYNNPLIKNLNHQNQGRLSHWFQIITRQKVLDSNNLKNQLINKVGKVKKISKENLESFNQEIENIVNKKNIDLETLKSETRKLANNQTIDLKTLKDKIKELEKVSNKTTEIDNKQLIDLEELEKRIKKIENTTTIDLIDLEDIIYKSQSKQDSLEITQLKFKEKLNELLIKKSDQNTRYELIQIKEKLLDDTTLPSYIPSDTFATTLLEVLRIPRLIHHLSCNKLKGLIKRLVKKLSDIKGFDSENCENFTRELKEIYDDFRHKKYTLEISLLRIKTRLNELIDAHSKDSENDSILVKNLKNIRETFFEENNFKILAQEMKLNLIYIAQILDPDLLNEDGKLDDAKTSEILEHDNTAVQANQNKEKWEEDFDKKFNDPKEQNEVQKEIEEILGKLPKTLKDSIVTLAHRAQTKINNTEQDIEQLSREIEIWFNNSMERASGVYKRNAKVLALIISFCIAVFANADTFHMVSRLSTDSILRDALVNSALALETTCQTDDSFDCIKSTTEQNLEELALPIGWSCTNFQQQTTISSVAIPWVDWPICEEKTKSLIENNHQQQKSKLPVSLVQFSKLFKMLFGWMVSAVAISMGASFWFDILSKLINVRNTGMKPSSTAQETTKSS